MEYVPDLKFQLKLRYINQVKAHLKPTNILEAVTAQMIIMVTRYFLHVTIENEEEELDSQIIILTNFILSRHL